MKRNKSFKTSGAPLFVVLFLIGFSAGYTTKEFIQRPDKNLDVAQHASLNRNTSVNYSKIPISVCFTPNKRCQSQIIDQIEQAKRSIFVQAYSFTDKEIVTALAKAARRGVEVKVLLDRSNRKDARSAKDILIQGHIPLRFDSPSGIAHNKIMIIDEDLVISGSYNFSAAAYKRNTENLLIITNSSLAHQYIQNWQARWRVSE